jgi:drug/metabolite transporter (DMT)-like permease
LTQKFVAQKMNTLLIFSVLSAAFLHAFWNFQVKDTPNKAVGMAAVMFGHLPLAGIGILFSGLPSLEAAPYLFASAFLHLGYQVFLLNAYKFGSLTSIYPIARGMAPLLITLVSILVLNEMLELSQIFGIVLISAAIICFGVAQYRLANAELTGLMLACATSCFIAGYSVVDAIGTRIAGSAIAFYGVSTFSSAILFAIYLQITNPGVMFSFHKEARSTLIFGGTASYLAYVIVLWACLHAPVAVVSSLRETSLLFAIILGAVLLKEKITVFKMIMIASILCGIFLLRLG